MSDYESVTRFQQKYAQIAGQDFQFIRKSAFMAKRGRKCKNSDLRTPEEIAEWEQICLASNKMQRRARLPEAPKPFDLWSYDTPHLLDELAGIREMILRIPVTLQTKSALQSAIDRIWRVEDDVRFLLSLQRDMQRSFAAKAAEFTSDSKKDKQEGPQKNKATATESHKLVGNSDCITPGGAS